MGAPSMSDRPPRIAKFLTPGRAVLLALGVLLLAFVLACYITGARFAAEVEEIKRRGEPVRVSELLPKVPPGQPNAADLYEQAFAVAPSSQDVNNAFENLGHWTPQERAAAEHLVATHPDYYDLLDRASRVQVCAFPVNWDDGFLVDQPYLGGMRDARVTLAVKAQVQALDGDLDDAAGTCSTLLRLAEHDRQSPLLSDLGTATGHHAMAVRELSRLLALGDPSPPLCRTLYAQLAKPDWPAAFVRMLKAERARGLAALTQVDRGLLFRSSGDEGVGVVWQARAYPFVARPWYNGDKTAYLRTMERQIEAYRMPWAQASQRLRQTDEETDTGPAHAAITRLLLIQVCHLRFTAARTAAQDGAAQIALALTVYHHDHGAYPASLAELARAGWQLPLDPFTQKPYHYRREGKGLPSGASAPTSPTTTPPPTTRTYSAQASPATTTSSGARGSGLERGR
jgi:hypothetical protein